MPHPFPDAAKFVVDSLHHQLHHPRIHPLSTIQLDGKKLHHSAAFAHLQRPLLNRPLQVPKQLGKRLAQPGKLLKIQFQPLGKQRGKFVAVGGNPLAAGVDIGMRYQRVHVVKRFRVGSLGFWSANIGS